MLASIGGLSKNQFCSRGAGLLCEGPNTGFTVVGLCESKQAIRRRGIF